jgi:glycerol dehydrogenase-like iron-containing ADH family enzyme
MGRGLAVIAICTVMLGTAVGGALYQHEIARRIRRVANRVSPPPEAPAGHPIERIVRDARRLRAELAPTAGTPMARRIAVCRAYDDLLADACRAVGIPDTLTDLPLGTERDAERLNVEHQLAEAGVRLSA